jgi:hypothetical protein
MKWMELKCEASLLTETAGARQHIFSFFYDVFCIQPPFHRSTSSSSRKGENEPFGWFNAKNDKAFPLSIGLG